MLKIDEDLKAFHVRMPSVERFIVLLTIAGLGAYCPVQKKQLRAIAGWPKDGIDLSPGFSDQRRTASAC
jgi:hypothetical protein